MSAALDDVRALLDDALALHRDLPAVADRLRAQRRRLDEPLRLALVGRVKSGKSTLLNALVGARVAPTDAGECTRVVTHYRHGATPRVQLHGTDGGRRTLPVRRADGGLLLELDGTPPEEVAQLVVDWPADDLRPATVVDTPGIASLSTGTSARTHGFLGTDGGPAGADAVVFLTRQPQPEDVAVLAAFQAGTGGEGALTTTITVLSRADEVGVGRLDALLAAETVARRMSADPRVRAVSSAVVPVAGLLALAGRTLRHGDYVALRALADADQSQVSRVLLTADRFTRPDAPVPLSAEVRAALLDRLGLFGVRLSIALVRTGVPDAGALAEELLQRSGLAELQRLLRVHFTDRGAQLRAGTALRLLESVLAEHPVAGDGELRAGLERLRLATPDLAELDLLARSRAAGSPLPADLRAEGERLLGAEGTGPTVRLGLPDGTPDGELRTAALEALARWRDAADDPLAAREAADAAEVVVRACEALLAGLDGSAPVVVGGPGPAAEQRDEGEHAQAGGGQ
ncbi:MAG TPA: dynamin family protein [Geodermatophilus sp.]|nr:dynamin family protein [Geodermatophilus sp.]